jgi:hypothetical protein
MTAWLGYGILSTVDDNESCFAFQSDLSTVRPRFDVQAPSKMPSNTAISDVTYSLTQQEGAADRTDDTTVDVRCKLIAEGTIPG